MGVITTADERRDSALEHIDDAIKDLADIVVGKVWGYDEYSRDYELKLFKLFSELAGIRHDFERDI